MCVVVNAAVAAVAAVAVVAAVAAVAAVAVVVAEKMVMAKKIHLQRIHLPIHQKLVLEVVQTVVFVVWAMFFESSNRLVLTLSDRM